MLLGLLVLAGAALVVTSTVLDHPAARKTRLPAAVLQAIKEVFPEAFSAMLSVWSSCSFSAFSEVSVLLFPPSDVPVSTVASLLTDRRADPPISATMLRDRESVLYCQRGVPFLERWWNFARAIT
jgi:hypothetical protein